MKKAGSILLIAVTLLFIGFVAGMFFARNDNSFSKNPSASVEKDPDITEIEQNASNEIHEWRVNINTASAEELDMLPGIGPALAQRILDYRSEHGLFTDISQLTNVSGIGESTLENLIEYVVLEDLP